MLHKVYKVLAAHDLHALICLEVEMLMRLAGEDAPRLMYHVHAPCWRYDQPVRPRVLAEDMMAGDRFPNDLGPPGVKFTTNRSPQAPSGLLLGDEIRLRAQAPLTAEPVAGLSYAGKWPACVKVRYYVANAPRRWRRYS